MILYGAIDIGSNAIRILITSYAEYDGVPDFQRVEYLRYPLRLGEDVFTTNTISDIKIEKLTKMMNAFRLIFEVFEVKSYKAVATSAMRDAINGKEVIELIKKKTNVFINIINGNQEADLLDKAIIKNIIDADYLHIDVGGGSTEINLISKKEKIASRSFNIGTVRSLHNIIPDATWQEMKHWIKDNTPHDFNVKAAIGTGGNIKKLYELSDTKNDDPLKLKKLEDLTNTLKELSVAQRMERYKLNEDRADVIVPAAEIVIKIMHWSDCDKIYAPNAGLADGIIIEQALSKTSFLL